MTTARRVSCGCPVAGVGRLAAEAEVGVLSRRRRGGGAFTSFTAAPAEERHPSRASRSFPASRPPPLRRGYLRSSYTGSGAPLGSDCGCPGTRSFLDGTGAARARTVHPGREEVVTPPVWLARHGETAEPFPRTAGGTRRAGQNDRALGAGRGASACVPGCKPARLSGGSSGGPLGHEGVDALRGVPLERAASHLLARERIGTGDAAAPAARRRPACPGR